MKTKLLAWLNSIKFYLIGAGIFILCLLFSFVSGCNRGKKLCKQDIVTNTVVITDPYWHRIADSLKNLPPKEKIKWEPQDTFFTPADTFFKDIDTMAILRDYYSIYQYAWEKSNDSLQVNLLTTVTKNKPIKYDLKYKILTPFVTNNTAVNNSVTWNRYLYGGVAMPVYPFKANSISNINYVSLDLIYGTEKMYVRANWEPYTKTYSIGTGIKLFKFKK